VVTPAAAEPRGPLAVLVAFGRPHTLIGTTLATVVLWAMALALLDVGVLDGLPTLVVTLVAALATNVFIVGINQMTDVEIDRINKPDLPVAAGDLSVSAGWSLVGGAAVLAVVLAAFSGPYLLAAIVVGLLVGAAYSLPPVRLKRFHLGAAAAITSVRAVVVNLLLFAHFTDVLGNGPSVPRYVWALTGMVLGLTIAIAWFKDVPDMVGDARHGIATLVLRLGVRRVLALGLGILVACYVSIVAAGIVGLDGVNGPALAVGHVGLLGATVAITRRIHLSDPSTLVVFYRDIWRLFFAEYLVFGAAALLA